MTIIQENGFTIMTADEGCTFVRKIDGFEIGSPIYLGIDYSTGEARTDLPEYYEEIKITDNNENT